MHTSPSDLNAQRHQEANATAFIYHVAQFVPYKIQRSEPEKLANNVFDFTHLTEPQYRGDLKKL